MKEGITSLGIRHETFSCSSNLWSSVRPKSSCDIVWRSQQCERDTTDCCQPQVNWHQGKFFSKAGIKQTFNLLPLLIQFCIQ